MDRSRHVLVTGGAGFIGSHLVERLLADGKSVVVIDDFSTGSWNNLDSVRNLPRLKIIDSTISACAELQKVVSQTESIYHLAAAVGVELVLKSPVRTLEVNVRETSVILEAASRHKVPLLLTSSSEVYGKSQKPFFSEEDDLVIGPPHVGRWGYACSKLLDEFLALAYAGQHALPVVIARLFNTVGPRQTAHYGMVLPRFIGAAKAAKPLPVYGDGSQTRSFCFVADTVEALIRLQNCESARGQIFNVGGEEETSIRALAELVIQVLGSKSEIRLVPYSKAYGRGFEDMLRRRPSIEKLARTIGFRPATPLKTIIQRTAG